MSFPPQQGPRGPWGQQPQDQGHHPAQPGQVQPGQARGYPQQDQSQEFWRQVAAGQVRQPPGSVPPQPPKSRAPMIAALVAVAIVVVIGGGLVALLAFAVSPSGTEEPPPTPPVVAETTAGEVSPGSVGLADCVDLASPYGGAMAVVECGSPESDYEVVDVLSTEDASQCWSSFGNAWEGSTYCLVLDVQQGDCLTSYQEDENVWPLKVDCAEPGVEDQVTKVEPVDDSTLVCGEEEGWYSFGDPPRTVCFGPIANA